MTNQPASPATPPPAPSMGDILRRPLIQSLLLFLVVLCVFVPTFWYTFVWDDWSTIAGNEAIRDWKNFGRMFTDPTTFSNYTNRKVAAMEWRPIRNIYFLITYSVHGLHPAGWHFNHVLLHCLASVLLFLMLRRLYFYKIAGDVSSNLPGKTSLALWLSALCWAIHPANTEVTAWLKSADDILANIFVYLTFIVLFPRHHRITVVRGILASLLFALGLLAKVSIAPIPMIFPIVYVLLAPDRLKALRSMPAWITTGLFFVVLVVFMICRKAILGKIEQVDYLAGNLSLMMATMTGALVRYFQLTFWPYWPTVQIGDYNGWRMAKSWSDPAVISSIFILALIGLGIIWTSRRSRVASAGWAFAILAFLPIANIIPMMQVMAERFLYFPMVGIALVATAGFVWCFTSRKSIWIPPAIAAALMVTTLVRLPVWDSDVALQDANVNAMPQNVRALRNKAVNLYAEGETTQALAIFLDMEKRFPKEPRPAVEANIMLEQAGFKTSATEHLEKLKERFPDKLEVISLQGDRARFAGEFAKAAEFYKMALEQEKEQSRLWYYYGYCNYELGNYEIARDALQRCLALEKLPEAQDLLTSAASRQNGNHVTQTGVTKSTHTLELK